MTRLCAVILGRTPSAYREMGLRTTPGIQAIVDSSSEFRDVAEAMPRGAERRVDVGEWAGVGALAVVVCDLGVEPTVGLGACDGVALADHESCSWWSENPGVMWPDGHSRS